MECKVCKTKSENIFNAKVLEKYDVQYFYCSKCSFLQTEEPHWLEEAYSSSINLSDTGIMYRNVNVRNSLSPLLSLFFGADKKYLDYAGGYGILARFLRDEGFDFYTIDPYTKNLICRGFDYVQNDKIELITAIEVFEHFVDPILEIEKMLKISKNIFFTTNLSPLPLPDKTWDYYGFNHGQHISFYNKKTLMFIAERYNLNFNTLAGRYHLLSTKKINPILFKLIVGLGWLGLLRFFKYFLNSKVKSDSDLFSKH